MILYAYIISLAALNQLRFYTLWAGSCLLNPP